MRNFLFVDLSKTGLKSFDGMAAGTFVDMHGRRVTFKPEELPIYLENTLAVLESTKDSNGSPVGLPIDLQDHNYQGGAGWIKNLVLDPARDVIKFEAEWTEAGAANISQNIRRYFSPSIDPKKKLIIGGSQTNYPATRDPMGRYLLRPLELSTGAMFLQEESLDEKSSAVRDAFYKEYPYSDYGSAWVREVYDDHIIYCAGDDMFWIDYTTGEDGAPTFAPMNEWKKVETTYVETSTTEATEVSMQKTGTFQSRMMELGREFIALFAQPDPQGSPPSGTPAPVITSGAPVTVDLQSPSVAAQIEAEVQKRTDAIAKAAERKTAAHDLAVKITAGTKEKPIGLSLKAEDVEAFLLSLPVEADAKAHSVINALFDAKVVSFEESGHGRTVPDGLEELPKEYAAKLDSGEMTVAQLSSPILALGDLSKYDLSKWQEKGK